MAETKTVWTPQEATDALRVCATCELQRHGHTYVEASALAKSWLDTILTQAKADAWDEGAGMTYGDDHGIPNPHREEDSDAH